MEPEHGPRSHRSAVAATWPAVPPRRDRRRAARAVAERRRPTRRRDPVHQRRRPRRCCTTMPTLVRSLTTSVQGVADAHPRRDPRPGAVERDDVRPRRELRRSRPVRVHVAAARLRHRREPRARCSALTMLAEGGKAVELVGARSTTTPPPRLARTVASARLFLDHPALARVVSRAGAAPHAQAGARQEVGRAVSRGAWPCSSARRSRSTSADLLPFCDRRTRLQHDVLLAVIEELGAPRHAYPAAASRRPAPCSPARSRTSTPAGSAPGTGCTGSSSVTC